MKTALRAALALLRALSLLVVASLPAGQALAQTNSYPYRSAPLSAPDLRGDMTNAYTDFAGSTAPTPNTLVSPAVPLQYQRWINTASGLPTEWMNFTGAASGWGQIGTLDTTNKLLIAPMGRGVPQSLASATTTDLGTVPETAITITGTASITSLGTSAAPGDIKVLTFTAGATLVYNATSLIVPGAANLTLAAGDIVTVEAIGSGDWQVTGRVRASAVNARSDLGLGSLATLGYAGPLSVASGNLTIGSGAVTSGMLGSGAAASNLGSGGVTASLLASGAALANLTSGSIGNALLTNSGMTLGSTALTLGGTVTSLSGLTLTSLALSGTVGGSPTYSGVQAISNTTASTSPSTGAETIAGGLGILGAVNTVGAVGILNTTYDNTTAGVNGGLRIINSLDGGLSDTPGIGGAVSATTIIDNLSGRGNGGQTLVEAINAVGDQQPTGSGGSYSDNYVIESDVDQSIANSTPTDPFGAGVNDVAFYASAMVNTSSSILGPTAAFWGLSADSASSADWFRFGMAVARIKYDGIVFEDYPGDTIHGFSDAGLWDNSESTRVIKVTGSHEYFADLSGATFSEPLFHGYPLSADDGLNVSGGFAYLSYNTTAVPSFGGLAISWNRSAANAEVVLANADSSATESFDFRQTTGTGTDKDLLNLTASGVLNFALPTTTTSAAAGGATALPATPAGYLEIEISGVVHKVPYY